MWTRARPSRMMPTGIADSRRRETPSTTATSAPGRVASGGSEEEGMISHRLRYVAPALSTLVIAAAATVGSVASSFAQEAALPPPPVAPSEPAGTVFVPVQLDFVLSGAYGALLWGEDKGYFAENGIDIDLIPGQGTDLAMQQINSGAVNMAIVDVGNYIEQR